MQTYVRHYSFGTIISTHIKNQKPQVLITFIIEQNSTYIQVCIYYFPLIDGNSDNEMSQTTSWM